MITEYDDELRRDALFLSAYFSIVEYGVDGLMGARTVVGRRFGRGQVLGLAVGFGSVFRRDSG